MNLLLTVLMMMGSHSGTDLARDWPYSRSPEWTVCRYEDGPVTWRKPCVWDARHRGNGDGQSFVIRRHRDGGDTVEYVTHRRAHYLVREARR
jgi:hypothetical protein